MKKIKDEFFVELAKRGEDINSSNLRDIIPECLADIMDDETIPVNEWSEFGQYCSHGTDRTDEGELICILEYLWQYETMYCQYEKMSPWDIFRESVSEDKKRDWIIQFSDETLKATNRWLSKVFHDACRRIMKKYEASSLQELVKKFIAEHADEHVFCNEEEIMSQLENCDIISELHIEKSFGDEYDWTSVDVHIVPNKLLSIEMKTMDSNGNSKEDELSFVVTENNFKEL